jgi:hypothetical protein
MTENELFYWLQGFFELTLCDGPAFLSLARAECIKRHVALARVSLRRGQQLGERVARIELLADMILTPGSGSSDELTQRMQELTTRLRTEVDAQFQHVIDPQAGDDDQQARLNEIHSGRRMPHGDDLIKC